MSRADDVPAEPVPEGFSSVGQDLSLVVVHIVEHESHSVIDAFRLVATIYMMYP